MTTRTPLMRWADMRNKNTPLEEVIKSFLMHRHDLSPATIANYTHQLAVFCRWLQAQFPRPPRIEDIEAGTVNAFLSHRRTTVSPQSAHAAWKALRSFATFLQERDLHSDRGGSALRNVRAPKCKDDARRALTDEEMLRLTQFASTGEMGGRDQTIVWTLLGCGLRSAELRGLRLTDVDLTERRLHIRASTSKSVHSRSVTIPIETVKQLDIYVSDHRTGSNENEDPLFTDRHGGPLTRDALVKLFNRLKVRAHIADLSAHMLRHTWATNFHRSASGSRFDLQVEGGWTTGRMVERYTKARPFEERRRAPSPFTAWKAALAGKRPSGRSPSQQESGRQKIRVA